LYETCLSGFFAAVRAGRERREGWQSAQFACSQLLPPSKVL
jgi:hypothetical protein